MKFLIPFWILLVLLPSSLSSQIHQGIPFVKNYLPIDYNGESQNWSIIQDDRGVMYFGNTKGLLEFDGTHWNFIDPLNAYVAKKDSNGTIFIAGNHEFGLLRTNDYGQVYYHSLMPLLPPEVTDISDFYSITFSSGKVYFGEHSGRIIIYDYSTIEVLFTPFSSIRMANIDSTIYVVSKDGLFTLQNNKLEKAKGAESFNGHSVVGMFKFNGKVLITTRLAGLFTYYNEELKHWNIKADEFLKKNQVYRTSKFNESYIAFGTVEDGMLLIDIEGNPVQHVNTDGGMVNHDHCAIYTDCSGNIWSGLENGISHIQINSPFTFYNKQSGLNNSAIYSMQTHDNKLFVGTAQGVMYRDLHSVNNPLSGARSFKYVKNNEGRKAWDFIELDEELIVSYSNRGIYKVENGSVTPMLTGNTPQLFVPDSTGNYLVCIRQHGGLVLLKKNAKSIVLHNIIKKSFQVEYLAKDSLENYWFCMSNGQLIKMKFTDDYSEIRTQETFTIDADLPDMTKVAPFNIGKEVFFGTANGTYKFYPEKKIFKKYEPINDITSDVFIYKTIKGDNGSYYFMAKDGDDDVLGSLKIVNHNIVGQVDKQPINQISKYEIRTLLPVDTNIFLIGCIDRLVQYNSNKSIKSKPKFNVLLRSVELMSDTDSIIFAGSLDNINLAHKNYEFNFTNNALRFKYAAVAFDESEQTVYSYRLLGYDDNWSTWNNKTEKEYSFLKKGDYTFEVKARDIYDEENYMRKFDFTINAAWYDTFTAWFVYIVLFVLLIRYIILLSIRRVQREKLALEDVVSERTSELAANRDEILEKNIELEQQKCKTLDSLNYAELIQSSMLVSQKEFNDHFTDSFILFKPKDIVSGDFYWLKQFKDKTMVAAIDCTGHGVPGAFLSIIGNSFLNEIMLNKADVLPAEILEILRSKIKDTLNPELNHVDTSNYIDSYLNSKVKDGMDLALCSIDNATLELTYSGANLPALVVRDNLVVELEPVGNPAGIYLKEEPFVNQTIQLHKNDMLYLFSDGYYDQFGGEDNKKYYFNNFKDLLLSVHVLPCEQQNKILSETLKKWKGSNVQIDDIMIIGMRV